MLKNQREFDEALNSLKSDVPDADEYASLSQIYLSDPIIDELNSLDPFSRSYRETAMRLYKKLRRSDTYDPRRDELSQMAGIPGDLWKGVVPWSFRSPKMIGEFLMSWGHIMMLIDLSSGTVLEYGSGSGQLALMLARCGLDVHCVDVDQPSLDLIKAQADQMELPIKCESALFGEGFDGKRFDRIIFFEAFHHAWAFEALLDRLSERLALDGRLILCGEPVVSSRTPSVPFPWGPRLDGLSIFCMRKYGWMELGFSEEFLSETFLRHGWLLMDHPFPNLGRASAYVARKGSGTTINIGEPNSIPSRFIAGWSDGEGLHRWTASEVAKFPFPSGTIATVCMNNMLNVAKPVTIRSGDAVEKLTITPGQERTVTLAGPVGSTIEIHTNVDRPSDIVPGSSDNRALGIAVKTIMFR